MTTSGTYKDQIVVYQAVNKIDGKRYIGVTKKGLDFRGRAHVSCAMSRPKSRFHNAIKLHGPENFAFSVLFQFDDYSIALKKERELICSLMPEYNLTLGGEGALGYRHTAESIKKMKLKAVGRPSPRIGLRHTQESIDKIKAAVRGKSARYWLGKNRSPETIAKISSKKTGVKRETQTEKELSQRKRAIRLAADSIRKQVRCLNDGLTFQSARDASAHYLLDKGSVAAVASGHRKSARGLRFEYIIGDSS